MDLVLAVLIIVTVVGLGVAGFIDSMNDFEEVGTGILVTGIGFVLLLVVLVLVWCLVGWLWNVRWTGFRQTIRPLILTAYVAVGVRVHGAFGSQYAREVAEYDPSRDCRDLIGDCAPQDGRVVWLILWALAGLMGVAGARHRACEMVEDDEHDEPAEQPVGG